MKIEHVRSHPLYLHWFPRLLWAVVAFVVLLVVGWLAVPPILKSQAERIGSEQLGRALTIGSIDFKPWTLELSLGDVTVAGANDVPGAPPQLALKRIYIDASIQSLVRLAPVVSAVRLDEPTVRITRLADGGYDFDDMVTRLAVSSGKPPGNPLQFAVYNVEVKGGSLDFDDQLMGKTHTVRELQLGVPFLSNFKSQLEVQVEPHLSLLLNGSKFDSVAQTTPFADSRKTEANLQLADVDLAPYLGYLPKNLPLQLQAGVMQARLKLQFEQQPTNSLKLTGEVEAQGFKANDTAGREALRFDSVKVVLDEVRLLERLVKVASIEVTGPQIDAVRDAKGRINLLTVPVSAPGSVRQAQGAAGVDAASAASKAASSAAVPAPQVADTWRIELAKANIKDGLVRFEDQNPSLRSGPVKYALQGFTLNVSSVSWPFTRPAEFSGSAALDQLKMSGGGSVASKGTLAPLATKPGAKQANAKPTAIASVPTGPITFEGSGTDQAAKVNVKLNGLPLALGAPFVDIFFVPRVAGKISANLDVIWEAPSKLEVSASQVQLDQLVLSEGAVGKGLTGKTQNLASVQTLLITNATVGVNTYKASLERMTVINPRVRVERAADQSWMFEHWIRAAKGRAEESTPVAAAAAEVAQSGSGQWAVNIGTIQVDGGSVAYLDNSTAQPVQMDLSEFKFETKNFVLGGKKPSPAALSVKVRSGQAETGRFDFKGMAGVEPPSLEGQVDLIHLPLEAVEAYFGNQLNIKVVRADTSFNGKVNVLMGHGGLAAKVTGDATIEDFRANGSAQVVTPSAPTAEANASPQLAAAVASSNTRRGRELLSWKVLNLRGIDVALAPGKAPVAGVAETALDDFYARIILNENGRLNLEDLVKSANNDADVRAEAATPVAATTSASASAVARIDPLAPVINLGPISMVNGRVAFSDFFIKPNYSADLSELTGKLSAFSSTQTAGAPQLADLELLGKAEGTASLDIKGKLNPLAKPLALDINAKVRDLELPPLSPYSIKYAGHGIERGKLTVDVQYLIQPNGQLTAENNIVLNQLTFGEAVPGAPSSLPVKLATALLADSNGVIDLNLPISGSLNDPQFSLMPVIFKILGNIIAKAVTAPFSALGKAFGGGSGNDELSTVVFAPGSDDLTPQAEEGLSKVAKALESKPALKLTVVGEANEAREREGYKRQRLLRRMRAEKRRNTMADGNAVASRNAAPGRSDASDITISDAEYPELIKALYKRASFPKPRNAMGLTKDLPVPEMEALLLANMRVPEEAMQQLAMQRGVAVRDYLAKQKLPTDRLFLGAPKLVEADEKWTPRANLSLAVP